MITELQEENHMLRRNTSCWVEPPLPLALKLHPRKVTVVDIAPPEQQTEVLVHVGALPDLLVVDGLWLIVV